MRNIYLKAAVLAATLAVIGLFSAPLPAGASGSLYDQWVPVSRSVSVTNSDYGTLFTYTGNVQFVGRSDLGLTVGGSFIGHRTMHFVVEIDEDAGTPDTFRWSSDGGASWAATGVAITGGAQTLTEGVTGTFGAVNGHTERDMWRWTQNTVGHSDVAAVAFTGTGLNDCTSSGTYVGNIPQRFRVEIDATGAADTYQWSNDSGVTWQATGVTITGATQHLSENVLVAFAAVNGHTVGDYWDIVATPASQQLIIGSINWTVTATKAAAYVLVLDQNDLNQIDILSFVTLGNGEIIYEPPVRLPIGVDLKLDTTAADTGVMYVNVNGWLKDVNP